MFRFLQRFLVVCLLLLMQGPAMLVQEIAWCKMLVTYSRENGLSRGVAETFNGTRPCPLCRKAEGLRKKAADQNAPENQRDIARKVKSWQATPAAGLWQLPGTGDGKLAATGAVAHSWFAIRAADAPPLPPPRRL